VWAWLWLILAAVSTLLGSPEQGAGLLLPAGFLFWKALRGGSRPWRRQADGSFPS